MSRVAVVGAGPAGLAAAIALRRLGVGDVVVLERERTAGGVPRHCDHTGFGLGDLHRCLRGPAYAARYVRMAERAGVGIRTETTVTGWRSATTLTLTSPQGVEELPADAVLLATGCRERPRSARLVPGTRPPGVFTTGSLQQLAHLQHERVGRRAVVVGAEHVSFSAVMTLAAAGCETVAMVTGHETHQTYAPLAWLAAGRRGVPVLTRTAIASIAGRTRVEAAELLDLDDGERRTVVCDTVVFTGDWIPDHELARAGGIVLDGATRGPRVDQYGRTATPGVFAAGNLVHAAETADVAARGGLATAGAIVTFLADRAWPPSVAIACEAPIAWVSPNAVAPGTLETLRPLVFRVDRFCEDRTIALIQGDRTLWHRRRRRLVPNRSLRLPARAIARVDPGGPPVRLALR